MAFPIPLSLSWGICLVLSFFYVYSFYVVAVETPSNGTGALLSTTNDTQVLLFGFCVWGEPHWPNEANGCSGSILNSHMAAFSVDVVMTWLVYILYKRLPVSTRDGNDSTQLPPAGGYFLSIGLVILMHGLLHFFIFVAIDCYAPTSSLPLLVTIIGYFLYFAFSAFLFYIILKAGFAGSSSGVSWPIGLGALLCAVVTVLLAVFAGTQWILTCIFAMSHVVASIVGSYANSAMFTKLMGWVFMVATIMGILELLECPNLYRPVGGHVWYDFFLHISVVLSVVPFFQAAVVRGKETKQR